MKPHLPYVARRRADAGLLRHHQHAKMGVCRVTVRVRLFVKEAAEYVGVSEATLERWRALRIGPPFGHVGRRVFYFASDIDDWLEQQVKHLSNSRHR